MSSFKGTIYLTRNFLTKNSSLENFANVFGLTHSINLAHNSKNSSQDNPPHPRKETLIVQKWISGKINYGAPIQKVEFIGG